MFKFRECSDSVWLGDWGASLIKGEEGLARCLTRRGEAEELRSSPDCNLSSTLSDWDAACDRPLSARQPQALDK